MCQFVPLVCNWKDSPPNGLACAAWDEYTHFAGIVTLLAIERLLSRMCSHVLLEVTSCCAGIVALFAAERFLSWMGPHVCLEGTSCCGGVVALFASKRLLSTMNQHVRFQISSMDAWVATLVASVRLLTIMHLSFEVFGHLEWETALNTQERLVFSFSFNRVILVRLVLCCLINQATKLREG